MARIVKKNEDDLKMKVTAANKLTYFFTVILLAVFPLFYRNYYYDILPAKYIFYYVSVLTMTVCVTVSLIVSVARNKNIDSVKPRSQAWKAVTVPDLCMFLLIVSVIISTLQSDFKFESFWGNEARYNGLFLWLIYGLAYIIITRYLKFKINLMDWFLAAGVLVCLFGITDYFGMDILHFKDNIRHTQRDIFTSTFGNINVYTAYVGMFSAVAITLYTTAKNRGRMIFYFIALVISYVAMIMGRSDNGYLAMGAIFAALPLYLFSTRTGIKRYFVSVAALLTSVWGIRVVNGLWPDRVFELDSIFGMMSRSDKLIYGVIISWLIIIAVYILDRKCPAEREKVGKLPRYLWTLFLVSVLIIVFYILYDANIASDGTKYEKFAGYLVFNDQWGTDRGFVWKLCIKHFRDFSFSRKLFGFGPDTFGILTHYYDFDTMINYNNVIFESAHNEYLHYLVTIGLTGTVMYIALLISSGYRIMKKAGDNPYAAATVFAILAYAAQATVNIAQPIITPIMFTLLMVGMAASRENLKEAGGSLK